MICLLPPSLSPLLYNAMLNYFPQDVLSKFPFLHSFALFGDFLLEEIFALYLPTRFVGSYLCSHAVVSVRIFQHWYFVYVLLFTLDYDRQGLESIYQERSALSDMRLIVYYGIEYHKLSSFIFKFVYFKLCIYYAF